MLLMVFIKPSHHTQAFFESSSDRFMELLELVILEGSQAMKLMAVGLLNFLLKDNFSVLIRQKQTHIHRIFDLFEATLRFNESVIDRQIQLSFLDVVKNLISFGESNILSNSEVAIQRLMKILFDGNLGLKKVLFQELLKCLAGYSFTPSRLRLEGKNTRGAFSKLDMSQLSKDAVDCH